MSAQSMTALGHANEVRFTHAATRREITSLPADCAAARVVELVCDPPADLRRMRLDLLLLSVPRLGPVQCRRIFATAGLSGAVRLGELKVRERLVLAAAVRAGERRAK